MSRIGFITRHPKRSLSALGTVLAASALIAGSGAFFTTSQSNPGNAFQSGTLSFDNYNGQDELGGKIFDVSGLYPGGAPEVQTATLKNTGDVPADFYISMSGVAGSQELLNGLNLKIENLDENQVVYNGTFGSLPSTLAGHINPGDDEQYEFTVTMPDTGADQSALMGKNSQLQFDWKAVSTS